MTNGVSKKLCITGITIGAIVGMSVGEEEKLYYAVIVGVLCVIATLVQAFLDWKK